MSHELDAWRAIAFRDNPGATETLNMSRTTLRQLFTTMDERAERAEADADRLAPFAEMVARGPRVPGTQAALDALAAHEEAKGQR